MSQYRYCIVLLSLVIHVLNKRKQTRPVKMTVEIKMILHKDNNNHSINKVHRRQNNVVYSNSVSHAKNGVIIG